MKGLMLQKGYLVAAAVLVLVSVFDSSQVRLLDVYKTGRIVIEPDPSFGKATDWGAFFFDDRQDMAVAPDGSIFVTNLNEHTIFKFDGSGKLVKKFGRKGQGPGDFTFPLDLSILDGRFLVVGEYALNRRISLFNLDGTFHKLLKTRQSAFSATALRDDQVAYLGIQYDGQGPTARQKTFLVLIIDTVSGTEREVMRWTTNQDYVMAGALFVGFGGDLGNVFIARSSRGNLLVGNTTDSRIDEYSPKGRKIRSFDLKMKPIPVTKKYIREYRRKAVREMKSQTAYQTSAQYRDAIDKLESIAIDHLFGEYLPLYKEMLVDSEGNILVFKNSECLENCPQVFQVYSPDGMFVCETELASEEFDVSIDSRFKRICFTDRGIFCLFVLRGDELRTPRLMKVDVAGAVTAFPTLAN